jgi:hypothetical protein
MKGKKKSYLSTTKRKIMTVFFINGESLPKLNIFKAYTSKYSMGFWLKIAF